MIKLIPLYNEIKIISNKINRQKFLTELNDYLNVIVRSRDYDIYVHLIRDFFNKNGLQWVGLTYNDMFNFIMKGSQNKVNQLYGDYLDLKQQLTKYNINETK